MAHVEPPWEGQSGPSTTKMSFFQRHRRTSSQTKEIPAESSTVPSSRVPSRVVFVAWLDKIVPPQRKYLGRSRRTFLWAIFGLFLCLLALILGLGIGLGTKKSSSSVALPFPSNTATFTGDITYYGTGLGACGITSADTDSICAVSRLLFDAVSTSGNPNENPLCGKKIRVQRADSTGVTRSIDVTVVDRCVDCAADDLDLSPTAFSELADQALGRTKATWAWLQ